MYAPKAAGVAVAILAYVMLLYACAGPVRSHEAPSGWAYDYSCCSAADCYEITDDDVEWLANEQRWLIKRTGEKLVDAADGIGAQTPGTFSYTKWSKDEHFHRCSHGQGNPDMGTICLYVPPRGY